MPATTRSPVSTNSDTAAVLGRNRHLLAPGGRPAPTGRSGYQSGEGADRGDEANPRPVPSRRRCRHTGKVSAVLVQGEADDGRLTGGHDAPDAGAGRRGHGGDATAVCPRLRKRHRRGRGGGRG